MPLYKEDLPTGCQAQGCDCGGRLYINARCHPGNGIDFFIEDGVMHFECKVCNRVIVAIHIASKGEVIYGQN